MVSSVTGIYVVNKLPKQKEKRLINYWNYYLSIQCKVLYFFLYLYKPKAITMKSFILWNRLSIFSFSWENILNLLCKFNWTRMENTKWKMIRNLMKLNWIEIKDAQQIIGSGRLVSTFTYLRDGALNWSFVECPQFLFPFNTSQIKVPGKEILQKREKWIL